MSESPSIARHISVAVCTWNRAALLRKTLEHFARLEVPVDFEWELIVVDNNSTDETQEVLAEFGAELPLRIFTARSPGKSNAANLAVREARGEYVLWADDDIRVSPDWMRQYVAAFRRYPDADVFGGRIEPWFEGTPPRWLSDGFAAVGRVYGAMDLRRPQGLVDFYPFGGNMAIRRSAHLRHPFDPRIGPVAGKAVPGEEWMLVRELRREGSQVVWVPEASVHHFVPRSSQTRRFLRTRFRQHGELLAQMETKPGLGAWFGRPLWLWREWLEHGLRAQVGQFFSPPELWLRSLACSAIAWGRIRNLGREVLY